MIKDISTGQAAEIIETRQPRGLYLCREANGLWTAIDNETGDAFTECFPTQTVARAWLGGEFEMTPNIAAQIGKAIEQRTAK